MIQLSSKNDGSSLCYDVIITHQKFKKSILMIFRVKSILNARPDNQQKQFRVSVDPFNVCITSSLLSFKRRLSQIFISTLLIVRNSLSIYSAFICGSCHVLSSHLKLWGVPLLGIENLPQKLICRHVISQ